MLRSEAVNLEDNGLLSELSPRNSTQKKGGSDRRE